MEQRVFSINGAETCVHLHAKKKKKKSIQRVILFTPLTKTNSHESQTEVENAKL